MDRVLFVRIRICRMWRIYRIGTMRCIVGGVAAHHHFPSGLRIKSAMM